VRTATPVAGATTPDAKVSKNADTFADCTNELTDIAREGLYQCSLLSLRNEAGTNDPVFASRKGGHLTERAVYGMVKRAAAKARINEAVSPHWLRHAHGSHAIDRGATLPEVQATLGHANVSTTSGYLHARPDTSSGLRLDPGVFLR